MKKLFVILAVASAAMLVSCGSSVESKAAYFAEKMANAAGSDAKESMIEDEIEKYLDGLTLAEAELFEAIFSSKYEAIIDGEDKKGEKEVLDGVGDELPKVYSKAYDGYLNVRAQPTTKGQILGRLSNGPEGAELLGVEGKWTKVRVNGVVGYVWSADLQSTPTEPVYIDAAAVVGEWYCANQVLSIKSNGKFVHRSGSMVSLDGTWSLYHSSVVLKYSDGDMASCNLNGDVIDFDGDIYHKK